MPTQLTAPVTQQATSATLDNFDLSVARNADLTVNAAETRFEATFVFRAGDGSVLDRRTLRRAGDALPAAVRTAIVNLQSAVINAARAGGLLPAGSDSADF